MKIKSINLTNIRCFKGASLRLSEGVNIFIGPNNNGKSTLLSCLRTIQQPYTLNPTFQRIRASPSYVILTLSGLEHIGIQNDSECRFTTDSSTLNIVGHGSINPLSNIWPENFIIPYLAKRKVAGYSEAIHLSELQQVTGTLHNLYAKIDNISNPQFQPAHSEYIEACSQILGFQVSASSSPNGKKAAYIIRNSEQIVLENMGEGIASLLGLIVDLCTAENKIFIIEEPENDLHPTALKGLLSLIAKKSENNQFFISTHSNIVAKQLGAESRTKIFNIQTSYEDKIPTSWIYPIETSEERAAALEELGYEMIDFDLWSLWLFLEEASAEKIIRDYLIPWHFNEKAKKIKTFSSSGISKIESKFEEFNKLFVYLHLTPVYKNKAFVLIDSGENEENIIKRLKETYVKRGWNEACFQQFSKHDFEAYYPERFQKEAQDALALPRKEKKAAKEALLAKVVQWIDQDETAAKTEFSQSAAEVIEKLKSILT